MRLRVFLFVSLLVVAGACTDDGDTASPTSSTSSTTTTTAPPQPPWAGPPPARAAVPAVLLTEWQRSEGRGECPPLTFADVGAGSGGVPRRADFGPGGWAVAWDLPGAPGVLADGQPSTTAGRSTFGLAGVAGPAVTGDDFDWPHDRTWADGSRAGWGVEGGGPDDPGAKWLAYVRMEGRTCLYNVWSHLGRAHLEHLLDALRRVQDA